MVVVVQIWGSKAYLASRTLFSSSRSAISVAQAISPASPVFWRWSRFSLRTCRDASRRTSGVLVPNREGCRLRL